MGMVAIDRNAVVRITGFALYDLWVLCMFYNTVLFACATDARSVLYLAFALSVAAIAATLLLFPHLVASPDRRVLSRNVTAAASGGMVVSVVFAAFADVSSPVGLVCLVLGALLSGVSSGVLFLGWVRLYSDLGSHAALVEMPLSWIAAALVDALLSYVPSLAAVVAVAAAAALSGILFRLSTYHRPARPMAMRPHEIDGRSKVLFGRGLAACACVGAIAGLSDMLNGYRFTTVPSYYELRLAAGIVLAAVLVLVCGRFFAKRAVRDLRRASVFLLTCGCLLTVFMSDLQGFPDVVISGIYQVSVITMLCAVCTDVGNYYDIPATGVAARVFPAIYLFEVLGCALGYAMTSVLGVTVGDVALISLGMSVVLIASSTLLFTDGDMEEAGVGVLLEREQEPDPTQPPAPTSQDGNADADEAVSAELAARLGLTPRESEMLVFLLRGRSIPRIQEELCISKGTANTHLRHIYQKAGVHTRQELIDLADSLPRA